jgi:nitrogenase molybdenum-iron protein beta chain
MVANKSKNVIQSKDSENPVIEAPRYGCALGGVYETTIGLKKAVPILHSGSGCGMAQIHGGTLAAGYNSGGDFGSNNTPCSSLVEEHVIFGGEEKLRNLIESSIQILNAELFVIVSGCVPSLIGDDVDAVVDEFRDKAPVIHVNAPGFNGNSFEGYELFFEAITDQLLTKKRKQKRLVNIFGVVPFQHIFWKGELQSIRKLLKLIGIEANILFTELNALDNLQKIPAASYNIVLSPWVGHRLAKKLEKKFETPFVSFPGVPIGTLQTNKFLKEIGKKLNISSEKIEKVIAEEEGRIYSIMEFGADVITLANPNSYFAVIADTNTAISLTKFLTDEISLLPDIIQITDNPPKEYREQIIKEFHSDEIPYEPEIIFENDSYKIKENLKNKTSAFTILFASSLESSLADQYRVLHLTITFPSYNRMVLLDNYVGYEGGAQLVEHFKSIKLGPM